MFRDESDEMRNARKTLSWQGVLLARAAPMLSDLSYRRQAAVRVPHMPCTGSVGGHEDIRPASSSPVRLRHQFRRRWTAPRRACWPPLPASASHSGCSPPQVETQPAPGLVAAPRARFAAVQPETRTRGACRHTYAPFSVRRTLRTGTRARARPLLLWRWPAPAALGPPSPLWGSSPPVGARPAGPASWPPARLLARLRSRRPRSPAWASRPRRPAARGDSVSGSSCCCHSGPGDHDHRADGGPSQCRASCPSGLRLSVTSLCQIRGPLRRAQVLTAGSACGRVSRLGPGTCRGLRVTVAPQARSFFFLGRKNFTQPESQLVQICKFTNLARISPGWRRSR